MTKYKSFLVTLAILLSYPEMANAQNGRLLGTLNSRYPTVSQVMDKENCHKGQLRKILSDSGISPENLRTLQVGQRVYYNGRSCQSAPSTSERQASFAILRMDAQRDQVQTLRAELSKARLENADITAKSTKAASDAKATLVTVTRQRDEARQELDAIAATSDNLRFGLMDLVSISAMCLCLGGLVAFFCFPPRRVKGEVNFVEEKTISYEGKPYTYRLLTAERKPGGELTPVYEHVGHPTCRVNRVFPQNFEKHAKMHFESDPPAVDETALGMAQQVRA